MDKIVELCYKCKNKAVWCYMPGKDSPSDYYCETHVPRGCSCQLDLKSGVKEILDQDGFTLLNPEDHFELAKDKLGRPLPCCEYSYDINGFVPLLEEIEKYTEYDNDDY